MTIMNIGKIIRKIKKVFDFSEHFNKLPDPRKRFFLPAAAVAWLTIWQFFFRRTYSLLAIDEYLRDLTLAEAYAVLKAIMPDEVRGEMLDRLKQKRKDGQPLISDSQISRVLCNIPPSQIEPLLLAMTMRCRRNKTWNWDTTDGRVVVAYDATGEGGSKERECIYCKGKDDGSGYYHLGVHLRQVGQEPEMTMAHRLVPRGKAEITIAKQMARDTIRECRGKYAHLVLGDGAYLDHEFFNLHTDVGMDVLVRVQQKDLDKLPKGMNIFEDAKAIFDISQGPTEEFTDAGRNRLVRIWDEEDFRTWEEVEVALRVLRMEFIDLSDGTSHVHWVVTTLKREEASAQQVYEYSVIRWHIENKEFRQEKYFEGLEHRQVHHKWGTPTLIAFYLLVANLIRWLAFRALPSIRRRLEHTRFALVHFRETLQEWWAIWLYEWAKKGLGHPP